MLQQKKMHSLNHHVITQTCEDTVFPRDSTKCTFPAIAESDSTTYNNVYFIQSLIQRQRARARCSPPSSSSKSSFSFSANPRAHIFCADETVCFFFSCCLNMFSYFTHSTTPQARGGIVRRHCLPWVCLWGGAGGAGGARLRQGHRVLQRTWLFRIKTHKLQYGLTLDLAWLKNQHETFFLNLLLLFFYKGCLYKKFHSISERMTYFIYICFFFQVVRGSKLTPIHIQLTCNNFFSPLSLPEVKGHIRKAFSSDGGVKGDPRAATYHQSQHRRE